MVRAVSLQQIEELIKQEIRTSESLLEVLRSECTALKQREQQDLELIVTQKNHYIQILENNASRRREILNDSAAETAYESWEALLTDCKKPQLLDDWNQFTQHITECQRLNEINGKMIARGQQALDQILHILRGQPDAPGLYTEAGNTAQQGSDPMTETRA